MRGPHAVNPLAQSASRVSGPASRHARGQLMSSVGGRVWLGQGHQLVANPKPAGDNFGLEVRSLVSPRVEVASPPPRRLAGSLVPYSDTRPCAATNCGLRTSARTRPPQHFLVWQLQRIQPLQHRPKARAGKKSAGNTRARRALARARGEGGCTRGTRKCGRCSRAQRACLARRA